MDDPSSPQRTPQPDLRTLHLWHMQPVRDLMVIAAVAGTIYAGYAMRTVTVPLLVALTLAYLFEPVVSRMAAWRGMNRPLAVSVILGGLAMLLVAAAGVLVPLAVGQTLSFGESLRSGRYDAAIERAVEIVPEQYRAEVREWTERVVHPSKTTGSSGATTSAPAWQGTEALPHATVEGAAPAKPASGADAASTSEPAKASVGFSIDESVVALMGAGSQRVYALTLAVLQLGLVAFLIPFYFYYFSVHWPSIVGYFAMFVPDAKREGVFELVREMDRAVAGFVRGRIAICVIMGVLFAVGWQLCGVPYGLALGLLTGAFSIVPYLGGIGLPLAVGLLVADQFGVDEASRMSLWAMLLWPTAVFIIVQSFEGYVLTPIIAGKATNLDPVTIVVAILAGGSVAGVYGMLLAIPIAACGKIAAKRWLLPRIIDWARGRATDPLPLDRR